MHKLITLVLFGLPVFTSAYHVFIFTNRCSFPIWLALSGNAGNENINLKDIKIDPRHSTGMPFPNGWTGKVWSKTHCDEKGTNCQTGDCGPNNDCHKNGPTTAATAVYFALDSLHQQDYYQVSLVNGFNVPVEVEPLQYQNSSYNAIGGHCMASGCKVDLNKVCPQELAVNELVGNQTQVIGCRSACQAFSSDQYCCTGTNRQEANCRSSSWSTDYAKLFHDSCPEAKTYPKDMLVVQSKFCESNSVRFNINFCMKKVVRG